MGLIADRDKQLNEAIATGKVLDVFNELYHPDVVMYENFDTECAGREANLAREQQFFGSIAEFRGGGVTKSAVNEEAGTSFAEMFFDCTLKDGSEMKMTEVAVREWKDGQVHRERFFYKPA